MKITSLISYAFFIFIAAALIDNISASSIATVEIQPKTEVAKEHIRLGNIAHISGVDNKFVKQLGALIIGKAPLPGKTRSINAQYIKLRLKQADIDVGQVRLVVPETVVIARSYVKISKAKIADIVSAYMQKKLASRGSGTTLKNIIVQKDIILPQGKVEYRIINEKLSDYSSRTAVYIDFTVDGYFNKKIRAMVDIERLADVVVTSRPLGRHKIITLEDISVKRVDISKLPANIISDPGKVIGKRTKRSINPATILRTDLVQLPPIVKRGDVVTIIAEADSFKITALGKIKKKAHRGERVKIINLNSGKEIYAQVLDSTTVKVTF